eukprot:500303_1
MDGFCIISMLFAYLICSVSSVSYLAATGWTLVYENDNTGGATYGQLTDLVDAVEDGADVKVSVDYDSTSSQNFWIPDYVWITGDHVYAQNTDQISISQLSTGDNDLGFQFFQNNAYHYHEMVNTFGQHHAARYRITGGAFISESKRRVGTKWFVKF